MLSIQQLVYVTPASAGLSFALISYISLKFSIRVWVGNMAKCIAAIFTYRFVRKMNEDVRTPSSNSVDTRYH